MVKVPDTVREMLEGGKEQAPAGVSVIRYSEIIVAYDLIDVIVV